MTSDNETRNPFLPRPGEQAAGARIAGSAHEGVSHELPDPATGRALCDVGWADAAAADAAAASAARVSHAWGHASPRNRASALRAIAQSLRENVQPLAEVISAESGKRLAEATGEVHFSASYFDWFAEAAIMPRDEQFVTDARRFLVQRKPVGVVAAVSPWNFPLSIPARKVAAALAAGCAVVQKASEVTPLSSLALTELCERHLPEGVIGVVVGDGELLTGALVDHDDVRAITFTGSTPVGQAVAARAMRSMTRVTMELGGRSPFVVCDDADAAVALEALMIAKFRNNGASCLAANNVFVHHDLYDDFLQELKARVLSLRSGDPADTSTDLGPMIRQSHVTRLNALVDTAKADGSTVWQGELPAGEGWFMAPTLVESAPGSHLWAEEIFGPVCLVRSFTDEDSVVAEVNGWRTGLGGYVISQDLEHQVKLASALDVGIVGVNNGAPNTPEVPFGGIGNSGLGREGGLSGMYEFTEEQTISLAR